MINGKKKTVIILVVLIGLNLAVWQIIFGLSQSQLLKIVFFDVGQGDAIFIETPQKTQILIDGGSGVGSGSGIMEKLGKELSFYDRDIDMVIFTHPDSDHIGGLVEVLKNYRAKIVGWPGVQSSQPLFQEFFNEADKAKSQKVILTEGYKIYVGKELVIEVLSPGSDFIGKEVKDYNSSSLVLRIVYGENEFIITGDITKSVEKKIVNSGENIASDVLKISHHGSSTASSDIFLEKVKPGLAVIQVGKDNKYGHPESEVLERLEKYGIKVMRTDELGDITMFSNGNKIEVR